MGFRMADYRLRVYRRYPNKDMRLVVIYLKPPGAAKSKAAKSINQNVFKISGMRHKFEIIRLWEQPYSDLLQYPGLLPLAILGRTRDRIQTLREISEAIDKIEDKKDKSNLAAATSVLAGLVLEKAVIQSVLREEIMKESVIYQDIKEQGRKEGREEEREEGRKREANLILRQLRKRIGAIDPSESTRISELSIEKLEALGDALLDFNSHDDLRAWLENN